MWTVRFSYNLAASYLQSELDVYESQEVEPERVHPTVQIPKDRSCVNSDLRDWPATGACVSTLCSYTRVNSCVWNTLRLNCYTWRMWQWFCFMADVWQLCYFSKNAWLRLYTTNQAVFRLRLHWARVAPYDKCLCDKLFAATAPTVWWHS